MQSLRRRVWATRFFENSVPDAFDAHFFNGLLGAEGEYSSPLFGKDGAYGTPFVDGEPNVLRHVHLVPLSDLTALKRWNLDWTRRARKRSDRHLVYVSDPYYGHLLLWILDEPGSHEIALMDTPEDRKLMLQFAQVAAHFIHTGEVIA